MKRRYGSLLLVLAAAIGRPASAQEMVAGPTLELAAQQTAQTTVTSEVIGLAACGKLGNQPTVVSEKGQKGTQYPAGTTGTNMSELIRSWRFETLDQRLDPNTEVNYAHGLPAVGWLHFRSKGWVLGYLEPRDPCVIARDPKVRDRQEPLASYVRVRAWVDEAGNLVVESYKEFAVLRAFRCGNAARDMWVPEIITSKVPASFLTAVRKHERVECLPVTIQISVSAAPQAPQAPPIRIAIELRWEPAPMQLEKVVVPTTFELPEYPAPVPDAPVVVTQPPVNIGPSYPAEMPFAGSLPTRGATASGGVPQERMERGGPSVYFVPSLRQQTQRQAPAHKPKPAPVCPGTQPPKPTVPGVTPPTTPPVTPPTTPVTPKPPVTTPPNATAGGGGDGNGMPAGGWGAEGNPLLPPPLPANQAPPYVNANGR